MADDRLDLLSYMDAYEANWNGLRSWDAVCRTEVLVEPGVAKPRVEVAVERLIADFENNRFLFCRTFERQALSDEEEAVLMEDGFILRDDLLYRFQSGRWGDPEPAADYQQVLDAYRVPDWRLVLLMHNARGNFRPWSHRNEELLQALPLQSESVQAIPLRGAQVGYELFESNGTGGRYVFQTESLMPTEVTWMNRDPKRAEKGMDAIVVLGKEQFAWERSAARYVPTEVTGNYIDRQFVGDVERLRTLDFESMSKEEIEALYIDVNLTRDMRFRWFSVDQPIKPSVFDVHSYAEPADFVALATAEPVP